MTPLWGWQQGKHRMTQFKKRFEKQLSKPGVHWMTSRRLPSICRAICINFALAQSPCVQRSAIGCNSPTFSGARQDQGADGHRHELRWSGCTCECHLKAGPKPSGHRLVILNKVNRNSYFTHKIMHAHIAHYGTCAPSLLSERNK